MFNEKIEMQELMNSDPVVKAQIGQANLDKMNQFMSQSIGQSGAGVGGMMTNGRGSCFQGTMTNGNKTGSRTGVEHGGGVANMGGSMMGSGR